MYCHVKYWHNIPVVQYPNLWSYLLCFSWIFTVFKKNHLKHLIRLSIATILHLLCSIFLHRWPKWRPRGPSQRTPTILDHVLSPTQSSRPNWSPPNLAASYFSGTGEAAPESQSPSKAIRSVQKQPGHLWHISGTFNRFKSLKCCVRTEGWFWTELMC